MNKLILAVTSALLVIPLHVLAQGSSVGTWVGDWSGAGGRRGGSMEMVVEVSGDSVLGRVRSTGSPGCSADWVQLAGVTEGKKFKARYNLGGQCGNVDVTYSIDAAGNDMTGSWSSQWPGSGAFRLTKQPTPEKK